MNDLEVITMGNLIVKDNALIEASHKLNEIEQRLILLAILEAREHCDSVEVLKGKKLVIHADSYMKIFGSTRQGAYKALKQAVMGLFEAKWGYRYINDKGNKVVVYERFTQSAEYIEAEGIVKFMFADAIIPMLIELEKRFTVYEVKQIANLSSSYSMRLYEFFMQHLDNESGKGWLKISLEDLRFRFGLLPTEYERMGDFKKRVLDYSIKEINQNTDLTASYEQHKRGRVITDFTFQFTRKTTAAAIQAASNNVKNENLFKGLSELERRAVQEHIDEHIKRLESKGEQVSDLHRTNITTKAVAERWGAEKAEKIQINNEFKEMEAKWEAIPVGTKYRHENGSIWIKEAGGFFHCPESKRTAPPAQAAEMLASGRFKPLEEEEKMKDNPWKQDVEEQHRKTNEKLLEVEKMPEGQLFQASDRTVYEKRGEHFYNVTHSDDLRPRSLRDAARCWVVDSWKPIDQMPPPATPSRIFQHYATEEDILTDRAKGLNPMDFLTDDERNEVNEIIEEYQESKDPEIYEFVVNILGIQLDKPKKPSLMARLKR